MREGFATSAARNHISFGETQRQQSQERTRKFFQAKGWETAKIEEVFQRRCESWLRAGQQWEEREEMKKEFGALFDEVLTALTQYDIIGIAGEYNSDAATEYEPEVGTIIPRLGEAQTARDVGRIVDDEFLRWFGLSRHRSDPVLQERFRLLVDDIGPLYSATGLKSCERRNAMNMYW